MASIRKRSNAWQVRIQRSGIPSRLRMNRRLLLLLLLLLVGLIVSTLSLPLFC